MKAVIFDMDGVISDTEHLHAGAEVGVLKRYGIDRDPEWVTANFAGMPAKEMYKELCIQEGRDDLNPEAMLNEKYEEILKLSAEDIVPMPGSQEFIAALHEAGFILGVASASRMVFVEKVVDALNVRQFFTALTTAHEVERGKPHPDVFLRAAQKLGIEPTQCIVIEDARSGVQAAKAAGMYCLGYANTPGQDLSAADRKIHSFSEVDISLLSTL